MTVVTGKFTNPIVDVIHWDNVRPVYKKLQDDFHLITTPFKIKLSDVDNLHLSHLIATIDSIDRILDNLPTRSERTEFAATLLRFLTESGNAIDSEFATDELHWRMRNLRNVLAILDIKDEFCATAAKVFEHTEEKRWANSGASLTHHLREEWRLAGHMTVLIMDGKATPEFKKFFYLCCEMMTAVDMIKDAHTDFRNGEISVKPSARLYAKLLGEFLIPLPRLFWSFPKPTNLIKYAFRFLWHVYVKGSLESNS